MLDGATFKHLRINHSKRFSENFALAKDEPSGLPSGVPVRDAFVAALPGDEAKVVLRGETIVAVGSSDLKKDLPVVDFLW